MRYIDTEYAKLKYKFDGGFTCPVLLDIKTSIPIYKVMGIISSDFFKTEPILSKLCVAPKKSVAISSVDGVTLETYMRDYPEDCI